MYVEGFFWRHRPDSNRSRSFCRAQPSHSATTPYNWMANLGKKSIIPTNLNTLISVLFHFDGDHFYIATNRRIDF